MTIATRLRYGAAAAAVTLWCAATAAHTATPAGTTQDGAAPVIVALGDSLTSGHGLASASEAYPSRLEEMFRGTGIPVRVLNHGVSGDTTAGGLERLPAALAAQPSVLIVALGANDGLRGIPIADVRANLESIITAAQERRIEVLLCGMETLPMYGWDYMVDFHRLFPALAARHNVQLVPFLLQGVVANDRMLLPDFIHPNAAGALRIARNIWPYLYSMVTRAAGQQVTRTSVRQPPRS